MSRKRVTKPALITKLREYRGNMATCAKFFHVTRQRIWQIVNADPELKEICDEESETFLDVAESKLFDAIEAGNVVAAIFYLKTKGRHRGYSERFELVPIEARSIEVELGVPATSEIETLNGDREAVGLLA